MARGLWAVLLVAAGLRLATLEQRPMHADEAIQADRLGDLLEGRAFRYDPSDLHGPGLVYASWPLARVVAGPSYQRLTEQLIRAVPALFGIALVLLSCRIAGSNRLAGVLAALFTAVSPAMVYYSRYYIAEMLLAFLSAVTIWALMQYVGAPSWRWAMLTGTAAGLMFATKETAVLSLAAMGLGLAVIRPRVRLRDLAFGITAAVLTLILLLRSDGLFEFLRSFPIYFTRSFNDSTHAQPWYFYFQLLGQSADIVFIALGMTAMLFVRRDPLARFLGVYSLSLTVAYCCLPYKTPWCALGFLHGWILLAGLAVARWMESSHRNAVVISAAAIVVGLSIQSWRLAFPLSSDPRNPWVYAHTTTDVLTIRDRLMDVVSPAGFDTRVQVGLAENVWPLPWYFRSLRSVTWLQRDWTQSRDLQLAPVLLFSPSAEAEVARTLYESRPPGERELYLPLFDRPVFLRPGVEIRGYAARSVLEPAR